MLRLGVGAALWGLAVAASATTQGVNEGEIVLGTIQDLSGPVASYGRQARQGMLLRLEEINEQGGIRGRRLRLVVEDSAYEPRRASAEAIPDAEASR